ncbi:PD40 domain-containing protein [Clostridium sp. KNHs214]|uniref:PD40 domain-containing protein n=1 Tax=Clostridium sp. KNHs214 TaxID=1540257 RepID=UPI0005566262|nr:PD40 domain-containing protein [Clostridium sp. KNHs214]
MKKKIFNNKPNKNVILPIMGLVLIGIFYGCSTMETRDNKLYEVYQDKNQNEIRKIDGQVITKGINPFRNTNFDQEFNNTLIAVSPDNKYIFYMSESKEVGNNKNIISGEVSSKFYLMLYDVQEKNSTVLKSDIDLVTLSKWNKQGNIIAFLSGEKLYIYSIDKKRFMFQDETKGDFVTYFGWSPDGKRLYTEHANLVNNTIYYMDSKEKIESYSSNESKYYKGVLDREHYYVTTNEITKSTLNKVSTFIVDDKGNKIKKVYNGKFRDSYKTSALLVGENDFRLYYINNINDSYKATVIDKKCIYDAKFIYNGDFAYTIKNKVEEESKFTLILMDKNGKERKRYPVSGGKFSISPDGKKAQIAGENKEQIDFETSSVQFSTGAVDKQTQEIFKAIRGASEVVAEYMCSGVYDMDETKKYFSNNDALNQYALLDMEYIYKDKNDIVATIPSSEYDLKLQAANYKVIDNTNAYVEVLGVMKNSGGSIINVDVEVALTYNAKESKWYVTGLSTFNYAEEYQKVKKLCMDYLVKGKEGKMFMGIFKDKELSLVQIQFWDIAKPGLAANIYNGNYCKVYIKLKEKPKDTIYKIILHKDAKGNWELTDLKNERLSYLY